MFYRFKSKLATQDRLQVFPVAVPGSGKNHFGPWITEYEDRLELLAKEKGGIEVYRAPIYDSTKYSLGMCFDESANLEHLPDIWGVSGYIIASEKLKAIVEELDDLNHEFLPLQWMDADFNPIDVGQPFYWFNLRRFLHIPPPSVPLTSDQVEFIPIPQEEDFVFSILSDSTLRSAVERYPLWRHYGLSGVEGRYSQARMTIYFNNEFYKKMRSAGLNGIRQYSRVHGDGEESVSPI